MRYAKRRGHLAGGFPQVLNGTSKEVAPALRCGVIRAVIYLDYNATTPIAPEVLEAMMPYLTSEWGNPSSAYKSGAKLKGVIETARAQVAELIGASGREIIFTSCATESNNAAIQAALMANPGKRHIVTSAVEHSSVLNYCRALEGNREIPEPRESATKEHKGTQSTSTGPRSHPADTLAPSDGERDGVRGYRVTYLPWTATDCSSWWIWKVRSRTTPPSCR